MGLVYLFDVAVVYLLDVAVVYLLDVVVLEGLARSCNGRYPA